MKYTLADAIAPSHRPPSLQWRVTILFLLTVGAVSAASGPSVIMVPARYHLFARDLVRITVFGEPDLNVERRIDGNGTISLPLIGTVAVEGMTVTNAEEAMRRLYIERQILVRPQVSVSVVEYSPREVSVIGAVKDPGRIKLPIETDSIDIVETIAKAGGITRLGRPESVRVTRKGPTGERTFSVDVKRMFNGQGGLPPFLVLPGDVVFVPERIL